MNQKLPDETLRPIHEALHGGNKSAAIKFHRQATDTGLTEAKAAQCAEAPERFPFPALRPCAGLLGGALMLAMVGMCVLVRAGEG